MDMEIALSFVVLAVMDCPISAHSFINKIPLHIIPHDFLRKFITPIVGKGSFPCWLSQDRQCPPQESPKGAQIYHLWWYICAHPVNGVNTLPRLSSVSAFVIPYRPRFHFRHWGQWIVGSSFSAFRFFSLFFFFSLATRCFACSNARNAFSQFLLVSFLLSIISDTSFFLCCVDSY